VNDLSFFGEIEWEAKESHRQTHTKGDDHWKEYLHAYARGHDNNNNNKTNGTDYFGIGL